tara:strand:- start:143595 stop:143795 length:201 start_codon:yes stop_codon:yes gene_type:complete
VDTESVIQFVLALTAIFLLSLLIRNFKSGRKIEKSQYSGLARSPEELLNPSAEAISEMEELISKLN